MPTNVIDVQFLSVENGHELMELVATWCCELCGRELRNLMLPDHNMMFAARWTTKVRSVDVLLEGPSGGTIAKLLVSYCGSNSS